MSDPWVEPTFNIMDIENEFTKNEHTIHQV